MSVFSRPYLSNGRAIRSSILAIAGLLVIFVLLLLILVMSKKTHWCCEKSFGQSNMNYWVFSSADIRFQLWSALLFRVTIQKPPPKEPPKVSISRWRYHPRCHADLVNMMCVAWRLIDWQWLSCDAVAGERNWRRTSVDWDERVRRLLLRRRSRVHGKQSYDLLLSRAARINKIEKHFTIVFELHKYELVSRSMGKICCGELRH